LDAKLKHIAKIEESSVEDNSTLERKVEESEKRLLELKQENHTLQSKNASLQKALEWAATQSNQINDTKNQIQDSLNKVTRQNKAQAAEIVDLKDNQDELDQKIKDLNSKIKDLYKREKIYKETNFTQ
jgi:chromosome segregation ATPase